jgi:hypothetical protein
MQSITTSLGLTASQQIEDEPRAVVLLIFYWCGTRICRMGVRKALGSHQFGFERQVMLQIVRLPSRMQLLGFLRPTSDL